MRVGEIYVEPDLTISGPDIQLFQHTEGKVDNECLLLFRRVTRACASHVFHAANEEFQLYPIITKFHGESMGLAVVVLELDLAQEISRDLDPE